MTIAGLSSDELRAIKAAGWGTDQWQAFAAVRVEDAGDIAVTGRYVVRTDAVAFEPAYPFDPGRRYVVRVEPSRLPTPRDAPAVLTTVALPAADVGEPVVVSAIDPTSDKWPSNSLRFYVHFSGPMAREPGAVFVRLLDDSGQEVKDAILQSTVDFWSPDQRRYTVFFDPGRVKRGLVPNMALGRALVPGRRYTIAIDAAWRDAMGRPLARDFRKAFTAGPPVERALRLTDWVVTPPRVGSRDPLVVRVPWPLDHALFTRTLGVSSGGEAVDGRVEVTAGDTEWQFLPATDWLASPHELVVMAELEDPSGNMIDQAFEVDDTAPPPPPRPERYTIPFVPRQ